MINFKEITKRNSAGICAVSMFAASAPAMIPVEAAETSTENPAFPSVDTLIAQATTLLGTKYGFGKKGYSGIYDQGSCKLLTEESIRGQGID